MAALDDFVLRQKDGARFVVTAQMLRLPPAEFDRLARGWIATGGPGFTVCGVPHRVVVNGQFYIGRVTVLRAGVPA